MSLPRTLIPVSPRLWDRIDFAGDCWEWTGNRYASGYPRMCVSPPRRMILPHRVIWQAMVGPIPKGFQIDHRCRNKGCVNPDHLEPVPPTVNVRRNPAHRTPRALRELCSRGHVKRQAPSGRYCPECQRISRRVRRGVA